jgi:hypothetical protein
MGDLLQTLVLVICGIIFLFLGYFLFFGTYSPIYRYLPWAKKSASKIKPDDFQSCPVCSKRILKGEVKTVVFPASSGRADRLMHIKGCVSCLEKDLPRRCPVCKANMSLEDFLVARMFERPFRKNHIHVLGCNHCKKTGVQTKSSTETL